MPAAPTVPFIMPIRCYLFIGLLGLLATGALAQTTPTKPSASGAAQIRSEVMPVFPGQEAADSTRTTSQRVMHFLNKDLRYPPKALRDDVSGRVFFSFTVNAQGRTTDIKLVKGLREDVDAEVLRVAHRLDGVQWRPGLQDGRPVSVSFTVPITLSISEGRTPGPPDGHTPDSLDRGPFRKFALPLADWSPDRTTMPTGKGLIYGSCLQRLAGSSSLGSGEYVRLVNLSTGKCFRLNVKPIMNSRRENAFCYALPAGRYALYLYEFPDPVWGPYRLHIESIRKPASSIETTPVADTRFGFTVEAGKLHYVGTWNLANEFEPAFLNEKSILDERLRGGYPNLRFGEAVVRVPQ